MMNFNSPEKKEELRELIHRLADKMHGRGDEWLLKDCTVREDSWYNRPSSESIQRCTGKEGNASKEVC